MTPARAGSDWPTPWPSRASAAPRPTPRVEAAAGHLLEVAAALAGAPPACSTAPERWWPDTGAGAEAAVAACLTCPAVAPCHAHAEVVRPDGSVAGAAVWGRSLRRAHAAHLAELHEASDPAVTP